MKTMVKKLDFHILLASLSLCFVSALARANL